MYNGQPQWVVVGRSLFGTFFSTFKAAAFAETAYHLLRRISLDFYTAYLSSLWRHRRSDRVEPQILMKASALGLQKRVGESRQSVEDLLKLKPDFCNNGRKLIQYYIKFDEIVERTITGLRNCGLSIE